MKTIISRIFLFILTVTTTEVNKLTIQLCRQIITGFSTIFSINYIAR